MGFLRKTVKKIGKAIKKVVKKVGKAFGKLGIVGQIGMMFLMPHLGAMWGNIGSWAAQGSNILQKAVGVIHKAGTAIGNTYKTVTEAIGNGFDRAKNFMKGDGLVLSPERTSIFAKPTDALTDKATENILSSSEISDIAKGTDATSKKLSDLIDPVKEVKEEVTEKVIEEVTQPSILDKVKDKAIDSFIQGGGDRIRKVAAGTEEIDYRNTYVNVGEMSPISSNRGVYESTDLSNQSFQMNNWQDIASIYSRQVNQRLG